MADRAAVERYRFASFRKCPLQADGDEAELPPWIDHHARLLERASSSTATLTTEASRRAVPDADEPHTLGYVAPVLAHRAMEGDLVARTLIRPGGRSERIQLAVHKAVRELMEEQPEQHLTVAMIAARAQVPPSTIYRRWQTLCLG